MISRFRCAENHTPQDHFRCVMVSYCTCTPQKTWPEGLHHNFTDTKMNDWVATLAFYAFLPGSVVVVLLASLAASGSSTSISSASRVLLTSLGTSGVRFLLKTCTRKKRYGQIFCFISPFISTANEQLKKP